MRFMSTMDGRPPKLFSFDSSPGHAIAVALGDLDEKSYQSELKEVLPDGEEVYEIRMRRAQTDVNPGPHPLQKVGVIHYKQPSYMSNLR
jgi:hypothetical protein